MFVWAREKGRLCIYLCGLITCVRLHEEEEEEEEKQESACGDSLLKFKPAK